MKKVIKIIGVIFFIFILMIFLVTKSWELPDDNIGKIDLSEVEDGIYVGEYISKPLKAIVDIEVKDNKIISIELIEHEYGFGKAAEGIIDLVIEEQSLQVDAISGATYSSSVILKSIENGLTK